MKRISFFLLFILCIVSAQAQRKFRFGLGLNYPIPIEKGGNQSSHLSAYLQASYRLTDRFNVDFGVHSESYTTNDDGWYVGSYSLAVVPGANYLFPLKTKKVLPYVGLGTGISFDFDSASDGLSGPHDARSSGLSAESRHSILQALGRNVPLLYYASRLRPLNGGHWLYILNACFTLDLCGVDFPK